MLKKIMEWTRRDPSRYGFGQASCLSVSPLISSFTMPRRHAKPCTLRRILRRLGLSYSKPRPVPRKTAPVEEQNMFKEKTGRTILGESGHGYAVLTVDETGILRKTCRATGGTRQRAATRCVPSSPPRQSDCSAR